MDKDRKRRLSHPVTRPESFDLPENPDDLRCSFCHKGQAEVRHLIASPSTLPSRAYICDECIAVAHSILEEDSELQ
jgi:hypothetical protein